MHSEELSLLDIYDVPYVHEQSIAWMYVVFCMGLLLLVFIVVRALIKKKKILSPFDQALEKLDELAKKEVRTQLQQKEFYYDISMIVKQFLSSCGKFDLQSLTDDELIVFLLENNFPSGVIAGAERITKGASAIKFADKGVSQEDTQKDLEVARTIISRFADLIDQKGPK